MKYLIKLGLVAITTLVLSACAYRINVLQGNFLDKDQVAKLRVQMSKDQVIYVLGRPIVNDTFDQNTWYYIYQVRYGNGEVKRKELVLTFNEERLVDMKGDYDKPEEFDTPLSI